MNQLHLNLSLFVCLLGMHFSEIKIGNMNSFVLFYYYLGLISPILNRYHKSYMDIGVFSSVCLSSHL